jgi:hypothetical protein
MRRKKVPTPKPGGPMGPLMAANLARNGYADITIRTAEIARLVTEKTGKSMSRQRVSAILKADRFEDETWEMIAKATGLKVSELMKPIQGPTR